jgi:hypothetical protein
MIPINQMIKPIWLGFYFNVETSSAVRDLRKPAGNAIR